MSRAKELLLGWHAQFTRFSAGSELSRLNADPRAEVPVSPLLGRLVELVGEAAERTAGLVDGTLLRELEVAGYRGDLRGSVPLPVALRLAPHRRPAAPSGVRRWRELRYDRVAGTVRRPPGVAVDGGGLAKGLFADLLARTLADCEAFGIDCAGDLRIGGAERDVLVADPFDPSRGVHTLVTTEGAVATSGIGRRSWLTAEGAPAHHLLDPATGRPAFTGLVQATALAPTAVEAEVLAKAALLSGPGGAAGGCRTAACSSPTTAVSRSQPLRTCERPRSRCSCRSACPTRPRSARRASCASPRP